VKATISEAKTIVLIPGLWLTSLSWENWVERYSQRGYKVIAESWPGMQGDVNSVRREQTQFENIGFGEVVEHYESIIKKLAAPPIIMGHSMGGVVTQLLLDRGFGSAGVAIDPGPIRGVLNLPLSSLKSAFPVLKNPANNHRAVMLTQEEFHYAFTNTMTPEESARLYERYAVPGPGKLLFQAALANFNPHAATRVDFHNDERAPLLLIAGELDHVAPPSVTRAEAKLQSKSKAVTAFKEYAGRSHYIIGQQGWEEVADFALQWALAPERIPVV
jgi:alpha-beta hydrolase superfamily lysophospholipase